MRIQLVAFLASPLASHEPGDIWEVEAEEGQRMIAAGVAIAVPAVEEPESKIKVAKREKR